MEVLEFGDKSKRKIILIHGFQSPYQVWDKYIKHYENEFHILVPILPGHNPKQIEDFISFEKVAGELEDYYITKYGKEVYAIYGMSMGGVLTATLWRRNKLCIHKLIFDGSPIVSINGFMKNMMTCFYLNITHKTQRRDKKTLEQAKKSAKYLAKHYSNVKVKCFKGRGHCELALLYPDMMIEELEEVL